MHVCEYYTSGINYTMTLAVSNLVACLLSLRVTKTLWMWSSCLGLRQLVTTESVSYQCWSVWEEAHHYTMHNQEQFCYSMSYKAIWTSITPSRDSNPLAKHMSTGRDIHFVICRNPKKIHILGTTGLIWKIICLKLLCFFFLFNFILEI